MNLKKMNGIRQLQKSIKVNFLHTLQKQPDSVSDCLGYAFFRLLFAIIQSDNLLSNILNRKAAKMHPA